MNKNQEKLQPIERIAHQTGEQLTPDRESLTPPSQSIGEYGKLRNQYLKDNKQKLLSELIFDDKINEHLVEVDLAARRRREQIIEVMMKNHPAPDKQTQPLEWSGYMNNLQSRANEIVLYELIYS